MFGLVWPERVAQSFVLHYGPGPGPVHTGEASVLAIAELDEDPVPMVAASQAEH